MDFLECVLVLFSKSIGVLTFFLLGFPGFFPKVSLLLFLFFFKFYFFGLPKIKTLFFLELPDWVPLKMP